jgi:hemoglobin
LLKHARNRDAAEGDVGMDRTLFEKCGGFAVVSKIVLDLYERLLEDDDLGPFFDNVEMRRIVDHQTKFLASLMGGPASYTDEQIRRLHDHLAIGPAHFDRLSAILAQTLRDHGMSEEDVAHVVGAFELRRRLVVG